MDDTEWLLDADPAIRWQVMRDLTHEPPDVVAAERTRVATEGWGARLLALQAEDGRRGGRPWSLEFTDTFHVLELLRRFGLDPASEPARRAIERVRSRVIWKGGAPVETPWDDHRFFEGEVEPCINGNVVATGAYFGVDVEPLVEGLLGHYDVLRGLDYLRDAGHDPADPRVDEAVAVVAGKADPDGRWRLDRVHEGESHIDMERAAEPSRWVTLIARRVLDWASR